jgi:uncharacterized membrane protein YdjX (TVP38/TMEM64 family)
MQAFLLELPAYAQGSAALGCAGLALAALIGAMLFVPRALLCLVGGFLFGWIALPVVLVAGTAGAALACLVARTLIRPKLVRLVDRRPTCRALLAAVDQEGWRVVGLLRLAGPLPCSAQSYVLGLTGIPIATVAATSFFAAIPQMALFVYLGSLGEAILRDGSPPPLHAALLVAGVVSVTVLVTLVGRRARRILAVAEPPGVQPRPRTDVPLAPLPE